MALNLIITPTHASDATARVIILYSILGPNVSMSNGNPITFAPSVGQRLRSGSVVSTYEETFVNFEVDGSSTLEMDEQTQIRVSSVGRHLTITLQSGHILMRAASQEEGQSIESIVGATGLRVHGTMFTVARTSMGEVTITMLSGHGEVRTGDSYSQNLIPLSAGYTVEILPFSYSQDNENVTVTRLDLELMNLFTLQAIRDNHDMLDENIFTSEILDGLYDLIDMRKAEQEELRAAQNLALEQWNIENMPSITEFPFFATPTPAPTPSRIPRPSSSSSPGSSEPITTTTPGALIFIPNVNVPSVKYFDDLA